MAPPPPPSASQTSSASSNIDYDTSTETAAAATPIEASQPPPPSTENQRDECVLCCYPLPIKENECLYKECCGELICCGCIVAQRRTLIIGTNVKKPIKGSKEEELEFKKILSSKQIIVCPFCRAKKPKNSKEHLKRLWERIDEYKDPIAMLVMGGCYFHGNKGLSKNLKKAEELYQQAYDLGDRTAVYNLTLQHDGHIHDEALMMECLREGAKREDASCTISSAICAAESGDHKEAKRLFMTAAALSNDGFIRDETRMRQYLEEGVKRGSASCMISLAYRAIQFGNHEEAKRLYMTAAQSVMMMRCRIS